MSRAVVCFGEVLMRLSPPGQERLLQSPQLRTYFGGAEANVAAGVANLGGRSAIVSRVPANALGDGALAALRAEGVDVGHVLRGGDRLGLYFVESGADVRPLRTVYDRANSGFSQIAPDAVDWPAVMAGASWFHVSGVTAALGAGPAGCALAGLEAARAAGVPSSLDLNHRPLLWGTRDPRPVMEPLAHACDTLVANPGAVQAMLGIATAGSPPEPHEALQETAARVAETYDCARVAITQRQVVSAGEHGWRASLYERASGTLHRGPRYQVRLVDRVGGGDSFVAALVFALLAGRDAPDALRFATAASALKLTVPGDFNRVTADEVDRLAATNP